MRQTLWPSDEGEHDREIAAFFAGALHDVALVSQQAHRSLGFEEVDRVVCFRKSLSQADAARFETPSS